MKNPWKVVGIATAIVAVTLLYWFFFASPFTVVNAGDGKVYKINKRTGESWLLVGNREIPITDQPLSQVSGESQALELAKKADTLKMWFSSLWQPYDTNETYIRRMLQINVEIDIHGWKAEKIDGDKYLVACTYEYKGQPRGYYFEVNLNTNTVRDIYADTTLAKQYAEFDIHPAYRIVEDKEAVEAEKAKGKDAAWWANSKKIRMEQIEVVE